VSTSSSSSKEPPNLRQLIRHSPIPDQQQHYNHPSSVKANNRAPEIDILAMPVKLTPPKDLKVLQHQIPAHGLTPNTSIQHKPLLIYKSAFSADVTAGEIEGHLSSVGVVSPQWRYTMYSRSHFHVSLSSIHTTPIQKVSDRPNTNIRRQPHTKFWGSLRARPSYALVTRIILGASRRRSARVMWLSSRRALRIDCWRMSRVGS
jgi:hypothetical protein